MKLGAMVAVCICLGCVDTAETRCASTSLEVAADADPRMQVNLDAYCDPGEVVTGGSCYGNNDPLVLDSRPAYGLDPTDAGREGWTCLFGGTWPATLIAYAVCLK